VELTPLISDLSRECSAGLTNPRHKYSSVPDTSDLFMQCDQQIYSHHTILHIQRNLQTMTTLINSTHVCELVWFLG
jgi:hypothetical protein